ncbi:hypothetical protein L3V64_004000 [Geobacillus stearothermophilus]|nr:hypothetical protein [Geobacillus stearothermophilus]
MIMQTPSAPQNRQSIKADGFFCSLAFLYNHTDLNRGHRLESFTMPTNKQTIPTPHAIPALPRRREISSDACTWVRSKEIAFSANETARDSNKKWANIHRNTRPSRFLRQRKTIVTTAINITTEKPPMSISITFSSIGK